VTNLKRGGACKLLSKSLKQMVEVRWNTLLDMLESFCGVLPEIIELLAVRRDSDRLDDWDGDLIGQLMEFLMPFRDVSVELQSKKVPTLHLVLIRYQDLLKHCTPTEEQRDTVHEVRSLNVCNACSGTSINYGTFRWWGEVHHFSTLCSVGGVNDECYVTFLPAD